MGGLVGRVGGSAREGLAFFACNTPVEPRHDTVSATRPLLSAHLTLRCGPCRGVWSPVSGQPPLPWRRGAAHAMDALWWTPMEAMRVVRMTSANTDTVAR